MTLGAIHIQGLQSINGRSTVLDHFAQENMCGTDIFPQIAKPIREQKPSTVEMRPRVDLRLAAISQPILAWVKPQSQIVKRHGKEKNQWP